MEISNRFFCLGWKIVNKDFIQQSAIKNKYLVLSTNKESNLIYIVNSIIRTYSYLVGMFDTSYKHQGAITAKYHIEIINFLPSLIPNDRMVFSYIASDKYKFFFFYNIY